MIFIAKLAFFHKPFQGQQRPLGMLAAEYALSTRKCAESGRPLSVLVKLWSLRSSHSLHICVIRRSCLRLLQACLASLHASMESKDWESATRHCARALTLPLDLTLGSFAETVVVRRIIIPTLISFVHLNSPRQKIICLPRRHCKMLVKSFSKYLPTSSRKLPKAEMQLRRAVSSSCSQRLDGKRKACNYTHRLSLI